MSMRLRRYRPGLLEQIASIPRWMWFFIGLVGLALALVPMVALARTTTSSSSYCITCHGTGDTPNRSHLSLVHPDFQSVKCVDCHAKPHQVVYEGYIQGFMAEPERVSPNCARCHQATTQTNEQRDFKFNFSNIQITHKNHLERGATCVTCHANVAHDLSPMPTNRPRMDACYSCHAQTDSCIKCHGNQIPEKPLPLPAPPSPDMLGDGRIYYLRICSACHGAKGNQVSKVDLRSREYLENKGEQGLFQVIANGKGNMHGFGLARGGSLHDDQIRAVIAYLEEEAVAKIPPSPQTLYNRYCLTCHGVQFDKVAGVTLNSPLFWKEKDLSLAFLSVQQGKSGMPAFGKGEYGNLTRQEIMALLDYIKEKAGPLPQLTPVTDERTPAQKREEPTKTLPDGHMLYQKYCQMCHGTTGSQLPMANLSSADYLRKMGREALIGATAEGKGGMPAMGKARGGPLEPPEVEAIIDYLIKGGK